VKLRPEQLRAQLQKALAPLWLIGGEELLLVEEAGDQLWQTARAQGVEERQVFHTQSGFDWQQVQEALESYGLFATRRLVEVRLEGKLTTAGRELLLLLAEQGVGNNLLLLRTGKLESATMRTAWYRAFERQGVVVQCWPVAAAALPRWIEQRLQGAGFRPEPGAAQLLAELVEGNLLAARQEVEKLQLLYPGGSLDREQVVAAVTNSARYSAFDLTEAVCRGDTVRALRILPRLREEGLEPPLLLGALCGDLRLLAEGEVASYLPKAKQQALGQAMRQGSRALWLALLVRAAGVDRVIKGLQRGDVWAELTALTVAMARRGAILEPL